jgi:hypothetical protein
VTARASDTARARRRWSAALGADPREHALFAVAEHRPRRVLDVGSGDGEFAEWCARRLTVEIVAVERGGVAVECGIPCALVQLFGDAVAFPAEVIYGNFGDKAFFAKSDEAIVSDPAEDARVRVRLRVLAGFPNPLIGLIPVGRHVAADLGEQSLCGACELAAMEGVLRDGIEDFSVNIELKLVLRGVADTYREGATITGQMRQGALAGGLTAEESVQDVQSRLCQTSCG